MATIVFIMLPETGHLNPTFKITKKLKAMGHQVFYSGPKYIEQQVIGQGFAFVPMFEKCFPEDFTYEQAAAVSWFAVLHTKLKLGTADGTSKALAMLADDLNALAKKTQLDLLLVDGCALPEVATVAHELKLPCALINTTLYDPFDKYGSVGTGPVFSSTVLKMPALFLCPKEFDFPRQRDKEQHYYVESSIDLKRKESDFCWDRILEDKKLIYCSFGTQSFLYEEGKQVLQTIMNGVASQDDYQMVMSIGSHLRVADFEPIPPNIVVVNHAPQLKMLQRASLMITHGGLNTIKECIYFGVPMIVLPIRRDQPRNAARVAFHRLGVMGNLQHITLEQVKALLDKVTGNESFRNNVQAMSRRFQELEAEEKSVKVIEMLLARYKSIQAARKPFAKP
jgi:UDP:flavonoid glycosyltransferase YjiC (YdhE family)